MRVPPDPYNQGIAAAPRAAGPLLRMEMPRAVQLPDAPPAVHELELIERGRMLHESAIGVQTDVEHAASPLPPSGTDSDGDVGERRPSEPGPGFSIAPRACPLAGSDKVSPAACMRASILTRLQRIAPLPACAPWTAARRRSSSAPGQPAAKRTNRLRSASLADTPARRRSVSRARRPSLAAGRGATRSAVHSQSSPRIRPIESASRATSARGIRSSHISINDATCGSASSR